MTGRTEPLAAPAWPALATGPEALRDASREWRDYALVTTRSPLLAATPLLSHPPATILIVASADRTELDRCAAEARLHRRVVGLGSGRPIDAAKYIAKVNRQPLSQVLATASNNACFTRTAWALEGGERKAERDCPVPDEIVADSTLIAAAPAALNRAGLAEILCSHTALFDWRIGRDAGLPVDWDESVRDMALGELAKLEELAPKVARDDVASFMGVIEACARFAPAFTSHPRGRFNAGSEHLFAWALDRNAGRPVIHGEGVSLGILLMSLLQGNDPAWAARIIAAARLPLRPEQIGLSWEVIRTTLLDLPRQAKTMPWRTVIDTLGAPEQAAARLAALPEQAQAFLDTLPARPAGAR